MDGRKLWSMPADAKTFKGKGECFQIFQHLDRLFGFVVIVIYCNTDNIIKIESEDNLGYSSSTSANENTISHTTRPTDNAIYYN